MRLEVAPAVLTDLKDFARYIARDKPGAASAWVQRLKDEFLVIERSPLIFPTVPEIGFGLRKARVGQYIVLFRTQGDVVRIERVIHGCATFPGTSDKGTCWQLLRTFNREKTRC